MRFSRLHIMNFRNFHELDVKLGPDVVVVGENRVGKSNLIYALHLLIDPALLPRRASLLRTFLFCEESLRPPTDRNNFQVNDSAGSSFCPPREL